MVVRIGEALNPGPMAGCGFDNPESGWEGSEDDACFGLEEDSGDCWDDDGGEGYPQSMGCNPRSDTFEETLNRRGSFFSAKAFDKAVDGYVFKLGISGLGYYADSLNRSDFEMRAVETGADRNTDATIQLGAMHAAWPDYMCKHDAAGICKETLVSTRRWTLPLWDLLFMASETTMLPVTRKRAKRKRPKRKRNVKRVGSSGVGELGREVLVIPEYVSAQSAWHNDHGIWAVDTVNANCLNGLLNYSSVSNADVMLAQESRVIDPELILSAEKKAKSNGWNLSVVPALLTEADGISAGVALTSRSFYGMTRRDIDFIPDPYRARVGCVHVGAMCRGGVHFVSVYFWHSEGLSQRNLDLMHYVAQLIKSLVGPWCMSADANMQPSVIQASGWLSLIGGKIMAPNGPTCGRMTYDFFIIDARLGDFALGVATVSDAGTHPHSPARLFLRGKFRNSLKRVLVHPRKIPALLPKGCLNDPSRHECVDPGECLDIDKVARVAIVAVESELVEILGASGKDADLMKGRHLGPKFVMRTAVGPVGNTYEKCSRVSAAWRTIAAWFKLILIHWGADRGGEGHLPALLKARWSVVHHEWHNLGDSTNAKALRRWVSYVSAFELSDKLRAMLLSRDANGIADAAAAHDANASRSSWHSWLQEGPSSGLGRQHKLSRTSAGWVPAKLGVTNECDSEDDDDDCVIIDDVHGLTEQEVCRAGATELVPLNAQQAVDYEAEGWGDIWQQAAIGQDPCWPEDMGETLPHIAVPKFRAACYTFPINVGLGWDKMHPRAVARCSDEVLKMVI